MIINYEFLIGSFSLFILVIYLILPTPEIIFKINNTMKNIKETKCNI